MIVNELSKKVFLVTPPFTQLNTPYPATAYIKGFLNTINVDSFQADLGIEVILALFSKKGLNALFDKIQADHLNLSNNAKRIVALRKDYIQTIESVIFFLQGKNPTLAHLIVQDNFLPQALRFSQLEDLDWAFGTLGTQDKAKHLATLYLEDISDLIIECVDDHFGFSRYAERLGRSANSFDDLYEALNKDITYIDTILLEILAQKIAVINPYLVAFSVPFPGNLYASFRCAQWIKKYHPHIKIAMGGGFANTELRSVSDARVFEFFDFITLDDGEAPIENLIQYINQERKEEDLKRTFLLKNNKVVYVNNLKSKDYNHFEVGTPDYRDLLLDQYISVLEMANPMHRMWSDGRWNKLTMAHGCYWGKCTFCDISLDYIKKYEPVAAILLVNRIEELITQTGQNGFHFVDEAAPPALMRDLALEIIRRKLVVTWWTNIRFEKSFTRNLCQLLKASGCIAVSGGLEVASDRLLELIQKGVTVAQVAKVARNFNNAGIMVHAYLMYGFPTQSIQETIDSLEMVRQMFAEGILQSAFWHQFAMTAHSPVGMFPQKFNVKNTSAIAGTFANNDLVHEDKIGANPDLFRYGLKKSLFNYMHGICLDDPLQNWFDFKVPKTTINQNFIRNTIEQDDLLLDKPTAKIVWTGSQPEAAYYTKSKKGNHKEMAALTFYAKSKDYQIQVEKKYAEWLLEILSIINIENEKVFTFNDLKQNFENKTGEDFEPFWYSKPLNTLKNEELLLL